MLFFIVLPWAAFWLLWRLFTLNGFCWRSAFLAAHVVCGVLIVASTEALSAVHVLNFISLFIFWGIVVGVLVGLLWRVPGAVRFAVRPLALSAWEKVLIASGVLIAAVVGFIALYAPPNTWDSMTYHMARVAHWIQNAGVGNYPTSIIRQLVYFPYAEYAILHAQVLSASDRFANMVQWTSMVASAVGVSLIAHMLGVKRSGQILSAVFVLSLPMGIMQGSSTQNDYVVTLWIVCCVVFLLRLGESWKKRWVVLGAASFGLAVLTKGTGLMVIFPFVVLWLCFFGPGLRRKAALCGAIMLATVVLNVAFWGRLQEINGNPFTAYRLADSIAVDRVRAASLVSNMSRHLATQLSLPWIAWNRGEAWIVQGIHHVLGIDPSDTNTTKEGPFRLWYFLDEDYVTNFPQMILIIIAAFLFWFVRPKGRLVWYFAASMILGTLTFLTVVKWQPWISRFHLPLFVLAAPLTVFVLIRSWSERAVAVAIMVLVLASIPALLWNNSRWILSSKSIFLSSRPALYFSKKRSEYEIYQKVADAFTVMNCRDIGLKIGIDTWEYPWWPLMGWPKESVRIEHLGVDNPSARFPFSRGEFHPCAIIAETGGSMPQMMVEGGRPYIRIAGSWIFMVYWDATRPPQRP